MTKNRASSPMRQLLRLVSGLIIIVSIFLCLLAFLRVLHSQSKLPPSFFTSRRSHAFIHEDQFKGPPKVALLFLVRWDLPLDFLWDTFFKNGDLAKFLIYIHPEPGFAFDDSTTRSAFFYSRQLNNSIQVVWGESSMIEAEDREWVELGGGGWVGRGRRDERRWLGRGCKVFVGVVVVVEGL